MSGGHITRTHNRVPLRGVCGSSAALGASQRDTAGSRCRRPRCWICGAARHGVAGLTGLTAEQDAMAFATCASIVRAGYNRWAAHRDPRFVRFVELERRQIAPSADRIVSHTSS